MMNYCIPDMYEMPHVGVGGYTMQGSGEPCMYPGEGPGYGHCEPQPLHHPPCMEQAWLPSQHYSCSYAGGPPVFKNEYCSMEIPLSHCHHQPEYFPEIKPQFSHLQWMQGVHKKGMTSRLWLFTSSRWKGDFYLGKIGARTLKYWEMVSIVLWLSIWIVCSMFLFLK